MRVYLVWEHCDQLDSVWIDPVKAGQRFKELQNECVYESGRVDTVETDVSHDKIVFTTVMTSASLAQGKSYLDTEVCGL